MQARPHFAPYFHPDVDLPPRRHPDAPMRAPAHANDNWRGGQPCPGCGSAASVRFDGGEYAGRGLVHQHWHCDACAHDWITVQHVSA
jgi:hypothetical protein